jgi:hypothetical protein
VYHHAWLHVLTKVLIETYSLPWLLFSYPLRSLTLCFILWALHFVFFTATRILSCILTGI